MAPPNDRFVEYYTEKLWELIPSIHRHEDGIAANPGVLRAIVELWGAELARLRRSQDRLWDDSFADLADDWAVPYIGDLVGTRLLSALNPRGRRIDVAKTIHYRRRKGTPRILEELISDITGWEGKVVEAFRGLARSRHGLDPAPGALAGRFSGTGPGGWADLRDVRAAALAGGPWDEFAHTPDVRRTRGTGGRWNIPKVIFHLWTLEERRLEAVMPFMLPTGGGTRFTFDPSGRDVPLFSPRARPEAFDWDDWKSARPWDVPAPIACRLLGHAEYEIEEQLVRSLVSASLLTNAQGDELRPLVNWRITSEARLREQLAIRPSGAIFTAPPVYDAILAGAIVSECGKAALLPAAITVEAPAGTAVPRERTVAANLSAWSAPAPGKRVAIDPDRGRLLFLSGPPPSVRVLYHDGLSGRIGAGAYDRHDSVISVPTITYAGGGAAIGPGTLPLDGSAELADSATYTPIPSVSNVRDLAIQGRDRQRPYLRLGAHWTITAAALIEARLVLEGLWLGATGAFHLILDGAWTSVAIRHSTLDPGGTDAAGNPIFPVSLVVQGKIDEIAIDHSILERIVLAPGAVVDRIVVRDSILHPTAGMHAIALAPGSVELARVTVLGSLDVERLSATEALITGDVDVTDTQSGCFRFSAAPAGSRLPRPYQSHVLVDAPTLFTSRRFGHPGYTQLGDAAPVEIARGAEDGSEMGAWSSLRNPIKLDSLGRKVSEYLPFGLVPSFARET